MSNELENLMERVRQNADNTVKMAEAVGRIIVLIERLDNRLEDALKRLAIIETKLGLDPAAGGQSKSP